MLRHVLHVAAFCFACQPHFAYFTSPQDFKAYRIILRIKILHNQRLVIYMPDFLILIQNLNLILYFCQKNIFYWMRNMKVVIIIIYCIRILFLP